MTSIHKLPSHKTREPLLFAGRGGFSDTLSHFRYNVTKVTLKCYSAEVYHSLNSEIRSLSMEACPLSSSLDAAPD